MRNEQRRFGGRTYDPARDGKRLSDQLHAVFHLMCDQKWRTLEQISRETGGSEASVSARLRDLRKVRFGAHTVEREYIAGGLWQYRVIPRLSLREVA